MKIKNAFEIKKLEWKDFAGEPLKNSYWLAYTFYNIKYTCQK